MQPPHRPFPIVRTTRPHQAFVAGASLAVLFGTAPTTVIACACELVSGPGFAYLESFGDPSNDPVDEIWIFPVEPGVFIDFDDPCGFPFQSPTGPWIIDQVFVDPLGNSRPGGGVRFVLDGGEAFVGGMYIALPVGGVPDGAPFTVECFCRDPNVGYDGPHVTPAILCDPLPPPPGGCEDASYMGLVADVFANNVCAPTVPAASRWGVAALALLIAAAGTIRGTRRRRTIAA